MGRQSEISICLANHSDLIQQCCPSLSLSVRAQALVCIASFLSREDCQLESLCLNESRLKEQTTVVLNAVATNTSLTTLNIRYTSIDRGGTFRWNSTDPFSCPSLSLFSPSSFSSRTHSGNQMQNRGARCLAKALLTNSKLKEVMWDHNETTLCGFQDVVNSLEQ